MSKLLNGSVQTGKLRAEELRDRNDTNILEFCSMLHPRGFECEIGGPSLFKLIQKKPKQSQCSILVSCVKTCKTARTCPMHH